MEKFTSLTAVAAPLAERNVDTDQIIPARFLKVPRAHGYADFLFCDRRQDRADFALNDQRWRAAKILVADDNFGCGSSREAAVYALMDGGFRCVIAPSFGDIFRSNAMKNGLLPVPLPQDQVTRLLDMLGRGNAGEVTVDLAAEQVTFPDGSQMRFAIDPHRRRCLLEGLDDIAFTRRHANEIDRFAAARADAAPWSLPQTKTAAS
ncbi:MAG: 3-isopropylmalate dehydratase small subunit [Alphaproteobacteria bacterium]